MPGLHQPIKHVISSARFGHNAIKTRPPERCVPGGTNGCKGRNRGSRGDAVSAYQSDHQPAWDRARPLPQRPVLWGTREMAVYSVSDLPHFHAAMRVHGSGRLSPLNIKAPDSRHGNPLMLDTLG